MRVRVYVRNLNIAKLRLSPGKINVSIREDHGVFAYVLISIGQIIVSTSVVHLGKRSFVIGRPCARHKEIVLARARACDEQDYAYLYRSTWH